MQKQLIVCIAALVALAGFAPAVAAGGVATAPTQDEFACEYPVERTDATGETVRLESAPDRVVALQPSDAQTAFEIGAEDAVVGMPIGDSTDYLDAGERDDVSAEEGVDVETVVGLEPNVVLAANITAPETVEQLRDAGLTVYHFHNAQSLNDVRENVRITGQFTGECEGAEETVGWMDERLGVVEDAVDGEDRPLAYWSLGFGWTAGNETFQHEILETAGVENLGTSAGIVGWQEISDEVVIEEDPEWIVYGYQNESDDPGLSEGATETTAYENDQVVGVDANYVNQPGPLVVLAIEEIVQQVHPDAYEDAQAALEDADGENETGDGEGTENATDGNATDESDDEPGDENGTDDGSDQNGTDETGDNESGDDEAGDDGVGDDGDESDDSIPGFGVPVAVTALVTALGIALRRR